MVGGIILLCVLLILILYCSYINANKLYDWQNGKSNSTAG